MKHLNDFAYIPDNTFNPDKNFADSKIRNFTGLPCPQKSVVELIGIEGVEAIDKNIKEMTRWKEILYGNDSNKIRFPSTIEFFDKNSPEVCITCSPLIILPEMRGYEKMKDKYYYRERADSRTGSYKMEICDYADVFQDEIFKILNSVK